ncbi:MAG: 16S rRNA (cytosine(967)-C(5))-methyltransferase RsmB [Gammaproteobacteria bacterium]|nr:16S rRNA (cytosine(967)-C(5))-methyltransferase RsmB [Gammaproteobacteria bacterium]
MQAKSANPRWLALKTLMLVIGQGRSLDSAADAVLADSTGLEARNLSLYQELLRGTCRWFLALQLILKPYLRKSFKSKDRDLEVILLIGLYQILLMRVDDHAAVNETVKLAQLQHKHWAKGLVNGILRQVIRDEVVIEAAHHAASYPQWMQQRISQDWPQHYAQVLEAGNSRAPLTLRVDIRQRSVESIIESLQNQGVTAARHEVVESAIVLDRACDVTRLDEFSAGLVSVQDAAAQLAVGLLDCRSKMRVLDACAAPGGKTAHLLQMVDDLVLIALDQDASRLQRVNQNLLRIDRHASLVCGDATAPEHWYEGSEFDRILADLPCSGSGVVRRHPDIKLLRRASDIAQLVDKQQRILVALWPLLKPGGLMLYSTCSIYKDENERQIEWFVKKHDNCVERPLDSVQWGEQRPWGRQILPGLYNMDGFFYACLQKVTADKM